jgi:hypothetical protein
VRGRRSPRKAPRLRRHRGRSARNEIVDRPCLSPAQLGSSGRVPWGLGPAMRTRRQALPQLVWGCASLTAANGALRNRPQHWRGASSNDCEIRQPNTAGEEGNSRGKHGFFLQRRRITRLSPHYLASARGIGLSPR